MTEEDFIPKIKIDIVMPADYPGLDFVRELGVLEPFGKGNTRPQFADRNLKLARAAVVGKNRNVIRLWLRTEQDHPVSAVYFGDAEAFLNYYREKYGESEVERALSGKENGILMSVVFYPQLNEYQGTKSVQLVIRNYR